MTVAEAKEFLRTKTLPMSNECLKKFKEALKLVVKEAFKLPVI